MGRDAQRLREAQTARRQAACGVEGCKLPWLEHFTKARTQKKALKDHFPADFQAAMTSARLIGSKKKVK